MLKMRRLPGGPIIVEDLEAKKVMSFTQFGEAWQYVKIKEFMARVDGRLPVRRTQTVDSLIPPEAYGSKRVTYKVAEVAI